MANSSSLSVFEEFCGGEFWDVYTTWNTTNPDFTDCFHKTVLAWIPAVLLILISPFDLRTYFKR